MSDVPPPSDGQDFSQYFEPTSPHVVERKKIKWEPSPFDKAKTFCGLMRARRAPVAFNRAVAQQYVDWGLVQPEEVTEELLANFESFRQLVWDVEKRIDSAGADFFE